MKRLQIVVTFLALLIVVSFGSGSNTYAFEGGEHKWLGDQAYSAALQVLVEQGILDQNRELFLQLNARISIDGTFPAQDILVTYGDLVALGGDFFEFPLNFTNDVNNDLSDLIEYFNEEISSAIIDDKTGEDYDTSNVALWWNSRDFGRLALHNYQHFVGHNLETYLHYHEIAIELSLQACSTKDATLLKLALMNNAFADHFLSDMFSSGHMRVPRIELTRLLTDIGYTLPEAGLLVSVIHDYDGNHGLDVSNINGDDPWRAFGDGYLFDFSEDPIRNQNMALIAMTYSIQEILNAYVACEPPTEFTSLNYIPLLDMNNSSLVQVFSLGMSTSGGDDLADIPSWQKEFAAILSDLTDLQLGEVFFTLDETDMGVVIRNLPNVMCEFHTAWENRTDFWSATYPWDNDRVIVDERIRDSILSVGATNAEFLIRYNVAAIRNAIQTATQTNIVGDIEQRYLNEVLAILRGYPLTVEKLPADLITILNQLELQPELDAIRQIPLEEYPCITGDEASVADLDLNLSGTANTYTIPLDCLAACDLFAWSPDNQHLSLVTSHDADAPTTSLYNLGNPNTAFQTITTLPSFQEFSPDGTQLLMSDLKGAVLRDVASGAVVREFPGNDEDCGFAGVDLSQDGLLVASNQGNTTRIWNANTGELLHELVTGAASCSPFSYSARWGRAMLTPSGDRLVTWTPGADIPFQVWDTATGSLVNTIQDATGFNAVSAILSPDGTQLAVATRSPILLFDIATGNLITRLAPPEGQFWAMVYSPDGTILATGGTYHYIFTTPRDTGHTITLWDTSTGDVVREIDAHSEAITDISFSPDGQTLASASNDHSIKLWNTASGDVVSTIQLPFEAPVDPLGDPASSTTVSFSPDGRYLLSISREDTDLNNQIVARLWSVSDLPEPSSSDATTETNQIVTATATPEPEISTLDENLARAESLYDSGDYESASPYYVAYFETVVGDGEFYPEVWHFLESELRVDNGFSGQCNGTLADYQNSSRDASLARNFDNALLDMMCVAILASTDTEQDIAQWGFGFIYNELGRDFALRNPVTIENLEAAQKYFFRALLSDPSDRSGVYRPNLRDSYADLLYLLSSDDSPEGLRQRIHYYLMIHQIDPNPQLLIDVAQFYEELDEIDQAIAYYQQFLVEYNQDNAFADDIRARINRLQGSADTEPTVILTATPLGQSDSDDSIIVTRSPIDEIDSITANSDWSPIEQDFDGVTMVLVPPGCFNMGGDAQAQMWEFGNWTMGVSDGGTQCFDEPFWFDKFEVTQVQFTVFGGQRASNNYYEGDNRPIESVTWFEARDFCLLRGTRLPSEAEWEYTARGPSNLIYPGGNSFIANNAVWHTGFRGTSDVGSISGGTSWVGALDMSGNVWEWTNSLYVPYPYDGSDGRESDDISGDTPRVVRGGSWSDSFDVYLRSTTRGGSNPNLSEWFNGFRCVRPYESVPSEFGGDGSGNTNSADNSTPVATTTIPVSTPILTGEPTATDTPSITQDCIATVTGVQSLNVRQGPGTQFSAVAQVSSGSQHDVVSFNDDRSWIQIQYENTPDAWISSQYATVSCEATINNADGANSSVEYGETIFADSFDDNQYDWELANGSYGVTDFFSDGGFTMQVNVSQNWEYWVTAPGFSDWSIAPIFTDPYEIEFTVDVNAPNSGYGIVVLFDVQQNYEPYKQLIINDNGTWQLIRWSGVREVLAEGTVSNNVNFNDGNIHAIALRVQIDQYILLFDGQEVAMMPSFDPINGTVGFGVSRGNTQNGDTFTARFHEIDIRSLISE